MAASLTYDALMLDHAAGALDAAATLVLNMHARLAPSGREAASLADVLGGAMLEALAPVAMHATPLAQGAWPAVRSQQDANAPQDRSESLIRLAQSDPGALSWRWRWFGVREHDLPVSGARLLKMRSGVAAPRHSHHSHELTLVLDGQYVDERGVYRVGDLAIAGPGETHRPRTLASEGCLCLTANVGAGPASAARARLDASAGRHII
jgi:putative transcriptional regulator